MRFDTLFLAIALSAASLPTYAADPVSGTTGGVWVNPNPGVAPIVTTGVGTSTFTWGQSTGATPANSVVFDNSPGTFASVTETPFKVGQLTYFNGTTSIGTNPDSVDLALTLDFNQPTLGAIVSDYTFKIVTTTNTDDPDASADYLYLPSAFSMTTFVIGDTTYDVKLTGFSNIVGDGFLASDDLALHVREAGTASADLYAVVTSEVAAVPEPQNVALLLAGLGMMGLVARRRGA
jgi:hypothetical protein